MGAKPSVRGRTTKRVQPKLKLGTPNDAFEQEADRVAEQVMRMPEPGVQRNCTACATVAAAGRPAPCPACAQEEIRRKSQGASAPGLPVASVRRIQGLHGGGVPLPTHERAYFEPRFGRSFDAVRIHTGSAAAEAANAIQAKAFTHGDDVAFNRGQYMPGTVEGRRLLGHELTHVVQQGVSTSRSAANHVQRTPAADEEDAGPEQASLAGLITDQEWQQIEMWQGLGEVGVDPLTGDAAHNSLVVADALFCHRWLLSGTTDEDPLLCVIDEVTQADSRVQQIAALVAARGPIINWSRVAVDQRMLHVMERLVDHHGFPVNGAAGLVGNLHAESGVLPNFIEGGRPRTPMTAPDFARNVRQFSAEEAMNRDFAQQEGPLRPGVGLVQWTSANRRQALFQHTFEGRQPGAAILFNMDAQIDFLARELQNSYTSVYNTVTRAGVSVNRAADEVVYRYEVPGSVLNSGRRRPRTDPAVQAIFINRRNRALRALEAYRAAHP